MRRRRESLGQRLGVDPQGVVQRLRHVLLDDRPAHVAQVAARRLAARVVGRRVDLHFVASGTDDGIFVAFGAAGGVEERPQPGLRSEVGREHHAAPLELRLLMGGEERHRTTQARHTHCSSSVRQERRRVGRYRVAGCDGGEQYCERNAGAAVVGHGVLPVVAAMHHDVAVSNRAGNGP